MRRLARRGLAQVADPYNKRAPLPDVAHIVAVASGKGGVGKSTTAACVAVALAQTLGLRVGLLDADVYGPSLPLLMGLPAGVPPPLDERRLMVPPLAHSVACMSMGLLMKPSAAAAWRGPLVSGALEKLLRGTAWPVLDVLLVDMPPGTGDAHISVSQKVPLAGALLVSTPQEMALLDARRGVDLYRQTGVPILGFVQNMAYFQLPDGSRSYVFGRDGVAAAAAAADAELLAEVPLLSAIVAASDAGVPVTAAGGDSEAAAPYVRIAQRLAAKLGLVRE